MKKINTSFYKDISQHNFSESQNSEISISNKNKKIYDIVSSSSFQIKPYLYEKKKMLIVLLLEKQIKFYLKPFIYNILKNYWKNKLFS